MTDRLVEYIIDTAENPELMAKHNANPKKAAEDYGLSPEDVKVVTDDNVDEMKRRCDAIGVKAKNTFLHTS